MKKRVVVVLDIDETLGVRRGQPSVNHEKNKYYFGVLGHNLDPSYFYLRPGLDKLLDFLRHHKIPTVLFTAASTKYAEDINAALNVGAMLCLGNESLIPSEDGELQKDTRIVRKALNKSAIDVDMFVVIDDNINVHYKFPVEEDIMMEVPHWSEEEDVEDCTFTDDVLPFLRETLLIL